MPGGIVLLGYDGIADRDSGRGCGEVGEELVRTVEHAVKDVVLLPGVQVDSEAESLGTVVVGQAASAHLS
jgi:hypothetical protein